MKSNLKRTVLIIIALFLMFGTGMLKAPAGISDDGFRVLGIFGGALLLWLTIGIDWPSLLVLLALSFVPSLSMKEVLASSFGNSTFAFLLFSFICTGALTGTSLIKRTALAFITNQFARKGPWQFAFVFFTAVILIGCFISPSVLFIVMLPILEEIFGLFHLEKDDAFARILMAGLVCCCGISAGMTPIGHIYGPLAMGTYETATGNSIDYFSYMAAAIPVGLITYCMMYLLFRYVFRPDVSMIEEINMDSLKMEGKVTRKEKLILIIFLLVVFLWIFPSFIKGTLPGLYAVLNEKGLAFPPLAGIILMSVITDEGKPLMDLKKVMKENVSWPALIMCAGTLALGTAMTADGVELNHWLSNMISPLTAGMSSETLILLFVLWTALQANFSSPIVAITVVCSIAVPVLLPFGNSVNTAAVISMVGMIGGYAFSAPSSMPAVAIAIGTGWIESKDMLKYGILVMITAVIVTLVVGYPIAAFLMH